MTSTDSALNRVFDYHQRSKHQPNRYARALGYLDWACQPDPFRRFDGTLRIALARPDIAVAPGFDAVVAAALPSRPVNHASLSQLLFDALAISAWKRSGDSRWAVRCNPSSGNLHPTEAYLVIPAIDGIGAGGVYHYGVLDHVLEQRRVIDETDFAELLPSSWPPSSFLVCLTSIYWREAWKYGERAYRYCQHDIGHAIAQLAYAAAALGWRVEVLHGVGDDAIAAITGIDQQHGAEAEQPDVMLLVTVAHAIPALSSWAPAPKATARVQQLPLLGNANQLSSQHHAWPAIDEVSVACHVVNPAAVTSVPLPPPLAVTARESSARYLFRTRRSAVAMDGKSGISSDDFFRMMTQLLPANITPWSAWKAASAIHPVVLVHRVQGLEPGVYLLLRDPAQRDALQQSLTRFPDWHAVPQAPPDLPLFALVHADARQFAQLSNCQQDIAADGAFSVAMLAQFDAPLQRQGSGWYRRLFWEAGMVGQVLYLEAEAAGVRGTGIGCFFDDVIHDMLGIHDRAFQSLYGFTVGVAVEDTRVETDTV